MKDLVISLYITTIPVILAGILNMVVVKQKWFKDRAVPIDLNHRLYDGHRVLGENKTFQGFLGMIVLSIITQIIWGMILSMSILTLERFNDFYTKYQNTILTNICIGALLGFTYMLFELPNSFLKRRFNIKSGSKGKGLVGFIFFIFDYIDSIIGIAFIIKVLCKIDIEKVLWYIILGGLTHLAVNIILYILKIKKEI